MRKIEPSRFPRTPGAMLLLVCVVLVVGADRATAAAAEGGRGTSVRPAARLEAAPLIHVVKRGETLTSIAAKYGIPLEVLAQANGLGNSNRIYAGQQLVIPTPGSEQAPPVENAGAAQVVHVVQRGENLSSIARKFGLPPAAIAQANGLGNSNRIYAGQRLVIPRAGEVAAGEEAAVVVAGEVAELAALIYAEAQANPVVWDEMIAIASVVRNRVEHVAAYPGDARWFGGSGYQGVIRNPREFPGYGTRRYRNFLAGTVGSPLEQIAAEHATRAAIQVYNNGAAYPFVFYQKAAWKPSVRAAGPPVHIGAHNFWTFRPECLDPAIPCRR